MPPSSDMSDAFGLGPYLRAQRRLAKLSLRQMADLAGVSNPYLSQIERGLHEPSVRILRAIADALNLSAETVLEQAGLLSRDETEATTTADAIRHDPYLSEDQKLALLSVYHSYRTSSTGGSYRTSSTGGAAAGPDGGGADAAEPNGSGAKAPRPRGPRRRTPDEAQPRT